MGMSVCKLFKLAFLNIVFMKKIILFSILSGLLISCKSTIKHNEAAVYDTVTIDTLFQEKISIRAISIEGTKVWYAANSGRFGYYDCKENVKNELVIQKDTLQLEFRSIAQTPKFIYVLSVANPALLYQISKKDFTFKLVYQEIHKDVFYDSMQFWNNKEGIAIGDPIEGTFSIIITKDGGNSWQKLPKGKSPKLTEGEAAFAASNTNIICKGDKVWLVSGGKKARVFYSEDKAESWSVFETPIIQGKAMTGIFTADFYDENNGFIAGGDYESPKQNSGNKALSTDGGKNWKLVAENKAFGYASCVQYVPNSQGKGIVVVGASGVFYSKDGGENWKQLSNDGTLFTIRFMNQTTAIAAGANKMVRINFK